MKTSIIIPTRGRAQQLIERVNTLLETVKDHDAEVVIVVDGDPDSCDAVDREMRTNVLWMPNGCTDKWLDSRVRMTWNTERLGPVASWNNGLRAAAGDVLVLGADDLLFKPGWLEAALAALATLPDGSGLVGLNDDSGRGDLRYIDREETTFRRFMPHYLVTRDFIATGLGGCLGVPAYGNYYLDIEACMRAQAVGRYVYAEESHVEHTHHQLHKSLKDATYQTGDAEARDLATFKRREAAGFPNDFEPIVKMTEAQQKRKALPSLAKKVSVILPSMGRASQLAQCVDQLFEATAVELADGLKFEVVIVIDEDVESRDAVQNQIAFDEQWNARVKLLYREQGNGPMAAWNAGLKESDGELIVLAADDQWYTPGWLTYALLALETIPDADGLVGLNDASGQEREYATHWLVTRRFISREMGGCLVTPHYQRQFCDPEACYRAKRAGRYAYAVRSVVEHRHWLWGKSERDEVYQLNNQAVFEQDRDLYAARLGGGFPNDFDPAIPVPRVFWAIPRERMMYDRAALFIERVAAYNELRGFIEIQAPYAATDAAREMYMRMFEQESDNPDDWLCMLDNDHEHPESVVEDLTRVEGAGVVSALCRRRGNEMDALMFRRNPETRLLDKIVKWPAGETIPVDMGGAGAIAIRRWVFDLLHQKYQQRYWLWRYVYDDNCPERPGEEVYFWRMCEDAGVKMVCDTSVVCPHLILTTVEKILAVAEAAAKGEDWHKVL